MTHEEFCTPFVPRNGSVLDVGSGKGKFLCVMAKQGFKVYGVEVNPEYVKDARQRAIQDNVVILVNNTQAERLPFFNDYFDFVNCAEVTEHVDDPILVCKEIYRVLKPGGYCYISFHNRFGFYDYHYHLYFINWLPRLWADFLLTKFHKQKLDGQAGRQRLISMHYFTFRQIYNLLMSLGFKVQDVREDKIRKYFGFFSVVMLSLYFVFIRPLLFNTFHILLKK